MAPTQNKQPLAHKDLFLELGKFKKEIITTMPHSTIVSMATSTVRQQSALQLNNRTTLHGKTSPSQADRDRG
jgi:hypothetical protein